MGVESEVQGVVFDFDDTSVLAVTRLRTVLCVLSIASLGGCGSQRSIDYGHELLSFHLEDAPVWTHSVRELAAGVDVVQPMDLGITVTALFATDASNGSPLRLYGRETGVLLDTVDAIGEGPGEVRRPWSLHRVTATSVVSVDVANRKVFHIDVATGGQLNLSGFIPFPAEGMYTHVVAATQTGGYILGGPTVEGRFTEMDGRGQVVRRFGELPERRDGQGRDFDLRGEYRGRPDRKMAAFVMTNADIIELYDLESGNRTAVVWGPWNHDPLSHGRGYIDLAAGENYIYALAAFQSEALPSNMGSTVLVFNWTGEFQGQIRLEGEYTAVSVDEAAGEMYLSRHAPAPAIVVADIPAELD